MEISLYTVSGAIDVVKQQRKLVRNEGKRYHCDATMTRTRTYGHGSAVNST